jgi:hypothetical protein
MTEDIVAMARAAQHDERLSDGALYGKLAAEIERLQDAKRRALAIADERSKENVRLRAALQKIIAEPYAAHAIARDALASVVGSMSND